MILPSISPSYPVSLPCFSIFTAAAIHLHLSSLIFMNSASAAEFTENIPSFSVQDKPRKNSLLKWGKETKKKNLLGKSGPQAKFHSDVGSIT